jgi:c-di-GMP-binding flagellar brake protein YcgR
MFASPVLKFEKEFHINADTMIDAILLKFPEQVKAVQRRTNYRVEVPLGSDLFIRVWRLGPGDYYKEQPSSLQEVKTELRDISIGGAGVRFIGRDGEPPKISPEDRLRILISNGNAKLVMEGQMRATVARGPGGDKLLSGIIFKKLQNDLEGRKIMAELTRIVGELQRDELRRIRLGLAKSA